MFDQEVWFNETEDWRKDKVKWEELGNELWSVIREVKESYFCGSVKEILQKNFKTLESLNGESLSSEKYSLYFWLYR